MPDKDRWDQYDATAANNTDIDGQSLDDSVATVDVLDTIFQNLMQDTAQWLADNNGTRNASTADTMTYTSAQTFTAYVDGMRFVIGGVTNTGAVTLNVDSLGAKDVKKYQGASIEALAANDIITGQPMQLVYDGTQFILLNPGTSSVSPIGQHTIWVPAGAMEVRVTTAPATSNVVEIGTSLIALRTMDFATDADDHAGFAIQMPKGWNEGTLLAQFVWSTDGSQTGGLDGVAWAIRAGAYASDDVLTTALGTAVVATAQDHSATANDVMITAETAAMTVAGSPGAEEWVYFEVYRDVSDAGDDLDIDARLHGVKIHYTIDAATDD